MTLLLLAGISATAASCSKNLIGNGDSADTGDTGFNYPGARLAPPDVGWRARVHVGNRKQ